MLTYQKRNVDKGLLNPYEIFKHLFLEIIMSIFSRFQELESKHKIRLHEGESFKQALYNGRMTDSVDCIIDKIELIIKHYPDSKGISLSTYSSDETSDETFCYAVVIPS